MHPDREVDIPLYKAPDVEADDERCDKSVLD